MEADSRPNRGSVMVRYCTLHIHIKWLSMSGHGLIPVHFLGEFPAVPWQGTATSSCKSTKHLKQCVSIRR